MSVAVSNLNPVEVALNGKPKSLDERVNARSSNLESFILNGIP